MKTRSRSIICISGIDGSGKTTQARLLVEALEGEGLDTSYLWNRWEPRLLGVLKRILSGGNRRGLPDHVDRDAPLARKRRLMRSAVFSRVWLAAASAEYALQARRRLRETRGEVVVSDRYLNDFVVDQALNRGGAPEDLEWVCQRVPRRLFEQATFSVVLTCRPEECLRRKCDGISEAGLGARQSLYEHLASVMDAVVIEAEGPVEEVTDRVVTAVLARLGRAEECDRAG